MKIRPGILWMLFAVLFFSAMYACSKAGARQASVPQVIFFRSFPGIPILAALMIRRRISFTPVEPRILALRAVFGFFGICLFFYGLAKLPLGNAVVLNATSPIFVALLSQPILGERVSRRTIFLLPLFVLGVVLIAKPNLSLLAIPSFAALGSGVCAALAYLSLRRAGRSDSTLTIVFYLSALATAGSAPMLVRHWNALDGNTMTLLLLSGLFATVAQLGLTKAYKLEPASTASLVNFAGPALGFIVGIVIFGEKPDSLAVLGTAIVMLCVYAVIKTRPSTPVGGEAL